MVMALAGGVEWPFAAGPWAIRPPATALKGDWR